MEYYRETPAVKAVVATYDATVSSSTEITLNAATTVIEVGAIDKAILLRWGTSDAAVATGSFDEVIPANSVRHFIVPVDESTGVRYTAVNFIEQAATALLFVCEK